MLGISEGRKDIEAIYQKNGISHVFAISGMHLGLIYNVIKKSLKKKKRRTKFFYSWLIVTLYYSIITKSASSRRAYTFLSLLTINKMISWKISKSKLFLLNLCIHFICFPFSLFQTGFQYSFLISFVFIKWNSKERNKVKALIKTSVLAFLFSVPITANTNYTINIWAILNNIILTPFVITILFPILLCSVLCPWLSLFPKILLDSFEKINILISQLPLTEIILPKISWYFFLIYYVFLILWITYKNRYSKMFLLIFFVGWYFSPKWQNFGYVHFLDVGQGDSILIVSPYQKEVILIDTGNKNSYLLENSIQFFHSLGIQEINALILTHGDLDHIGNALQLLEQFPVKHIILNRGLDTNIETEIKRKYPDLIEEKYSSEFLKLQTISLTVKGTENQNSIVNHVCIYQTCFLFLGDLDQNGEKELLQKYKFSAEILKVGHHGSKTSTSRNLLKQKWEYAIISAGRNNLYHHPNKEVINRLQEKQIKILNTQALGTISFQIHQKGYTIFTCPP